MNRFIWILIAGLTMGVPLAQAGGGCPHSDKGCSMHSGHSCCSGAKEGKKGLEEKLPAKADFILDHQQELGLSDEQAAEIRKLKSDAKKTCITKDAEVEIVKLDIEAALQAYPIADKALTSLIQQKYELKKEKALGLADAYTKLKNSLSSEQYETLKTLWKNQHSCSKRCPLSAGKPPLLVKTAETGEKQAS